MNDWFPRWIIQMHIAWSVVFLVLTRIDRAITHGGAWRWASVVIGLVFGAVCIHWVFSRQRW